jgi:hypothetical protein
VSEHKLAFETDDYYGPTMKLVVDCASVGAVDFSIRGDMSREISSALTYTLYDDEDVKKLIVELLAWLDRLNERRARRD